MSFMTYIRISEKATFNDLIPDRETLTRPIAAVP